MVGEHGVPRYLCEIVELAGTDSRRRGLHSQQVINRQQLYRVHQIYGSYSRVRNDGTSGAALGRAIKDLVRYSFSPLLPHTADQRYIDMTGLRSSTCFSWRTHLPAILEQLDIYPRQR